MKKLAAAELIGRSSRGSRWTRRLAAERARQARWDPYFTYYATEQDNGLDFVAAAGFAR